MADHEAIVSTINRYTTPKHLRNLYSLGGSDCVLSSIKPLIGAIDLNIEQGNYRELEMFKAMQSEIFRRFEDVLGDVFHEIEAPLRYLFDF